MSRSGAVENEAGFVEKSGSTKACSGSRFGANLVVWIAKFAVKHESRRMSGSGEAKSGSIRGREWIDDTVKQGPTRCAMAQTRRKLGFTGEMTRSERAHTGRVMCRWRKAAAGNVANSTT
jgi:hypothetical protein